MRQGTSQKGLTLIETVVYISVLVVVIVGIVSAVVFATRTLGELKVSRDVRNSAITALERMGRDIRQAESIDVGASSFDTNADNVVLNTGGTPTTVEFYLDGGVVKVREEGSYTGDLTLPSVTATSLTFRQMTTANSSGVKVELSLQNTEGAVVATTTFYTSGVLRGSY